MKSLFFLEKERGCVCYLSCDFFFRERDGLHFFMESVRLVLIESCFTHKVVDFFIECYFYGFFNFLCFSW